LLVTQLVAPAAGPAETRTPTTRAPGRFSATLPERTWTKQGGKGVRGVLAKWDETHAWILTPAGTHGKVRIDDLSLADQEAIRNFISVLDQ